MIDIIHQIVNSIPYQKVIRVILQAALVIISIIVIINIIIIIIKSIQYSHFDLEQQPTYYYYRINSSYFRPTWQQYTWS